MSAKGPKHLYTYRPKMGDVVIFPNGVEFNYSEHDQTVVVVPPKDHILNRATVPGTYTWLIGSERQA